MKIPRLSCFILAAVAMVLLAGAAQAAMKAQWIDYNQGNTALPGHLTVLAWYRSQSNRRI